MTQALHGRHLTPSQLDELHNWLADGLPYDQLVKNMRANWTFVISSPAITYHRRRYASRIAGLHLSHLTAEAKRQHDRDAKRLSRAAKKAQEHG